MRGTLFWVLLIRILLFRVLYLGPLFSEMDSGSSELEVGIQGSGFRLGLYRFVFRVYIRGHHPTSGAEGT